MVAFPVLKTVATILSAVTMVVAIHSHYASFWVKGSDALPQKPYKICDEEEVNWDLEGENCPNIKMEQYFAFMTVVSFISSLISLVVTCLGRLERSRCLRFMDVIFHLLRAALLLGGASLYALSTEQIRKLTGTDEEYQQKTGIEDAHFLRDEKLIAAALGILQSVLYVVIAVRGCCCGGTSATTV